MLGHHRRIKETCRRSSKIKESDTTLRISRRTRTRTHLDEFMYHGNWLGGFKKLFKISFNVKFIWNNSYLYCGCRWKWMMKMNDYSSRSLVPMLHVVHSCLYFQFLYFCLFLRGSYCLWGWGNWGQGVCDKPIYCRDIIRKAAGTWEHREQMKKNKGTTSERPWSVPKKRLCLVSVHFWNVCAAVCIALEVYLPIFHNDVLRIRMKTSVLSGLAVRSHYHQISTWFHAVAQIHIIVERHFQWVVLLSIRRGEWWTIVKSILKVKLPYPAKIKKIKVNRQFSRNLHWWDKLTYQNFRGYKNFRL